MPRKLKDCIYPAVRNPETNRCKKPIAPKVEKEKKACKEGQQRNPATGKCKNIVPRAKPAPKPKAEKKIPKCAFWQEYNPATNRCRKIRYKEEVKKIPVNMEDLDKQYGFYDKQEFLNKLKSFIVMTEMAEGITRISGRESEVIKVSLMRSAGSLLEAGLYLLNKAGYDIGYETPLEEVIELVQQL